MTSKLLKAVYKIDNLEKAWQVIQENGRASNSPTVKLELEKFAENSSAKIRAIQHSLSRNKFIYAPAKAIPIPKVDSKGNKTGKIRPLVLAPVESRILQRAVLNVLIDVEALQPFIKSEFSFGGIRADRRVSGKKINRSESISAVPAAIKAVITSMSKGNYYFANADIRSFFTRISKSAVLSIVGAAVQDDEFLKFFEASINVELSNLADLKENQAAEFPIENIGVAQGNSLSPLLGNIILAAFDKELNKGDCCCIRYIDDFIILGPNQKAVNARLKKAKELLSELNMTLSEEKSAKGARHISEGFEFLGINIEPGLIRPSEKARQKFLDAINNKFEEGRKALVGRRNGHELTRPQSLLGTLKNIDGMIDGWGKHYWFCNDVQIFANLDKKISDEVKKFLGLYSEVRNDLDEKFRAELLGLSELHKQSREPFEYPKIKGK